MPLFFFISGYIINKVTNINKLQEVIHFYKRKFLNLIIPTVVWTLIVDYLFFSNRFHIPTEMDVIACFSDNGHLWFLTTLFYMMLVVGIYRWCIAKDKRLLSVAILVISLGIFAEMYVYLGVLKKCTLYAPYFFAGLLVSTYPLLEKIIRNNYIYAFSVITFCCISGYWVSGHTSLFNVSIRFLSAITAIIAIYNIVNRIQWNVYADKLIRLIGVNTLSVYVAHWYFLDTVSVSLNWALALLQLTFYAVIITLLCIGIDKILSNLRIFRLLFYGKLK